jgi:hypothetical protein
MLAAHSSPTKEKNVVAASNEIVSCLQNHSQNTCSTSFQHNSSFSFLTCFHSILQKYKASTHLKIIIEIFLDNVSSFYIYTGNYLGLRNSSLHRYLSICLLCHVRFRVSFCREQSIRQVPHQLKFYSDIAFRIL